MNIYKFIDLTIGNPWCLVSVTLSGIAMKLYITGHLLKNKPLPSSSSRPRSILLILLLTTIVTEATWIPKILQEMNPAYLSYNMVIFFIRLAWIFDVVHAQALSLFVEHLLEKRYALSKYRLSSFILSSALSLYYLYIAFFDFNVIDKFTRHQRYEFVMFALTYIYKFILIFYCLFKAYQKIKNKELPKILHKQLHLLIKYLILPFAVVEFIAFNPLCEIITAMKSVTWITDNYIFVNCSILLLTYAIIFAARKIMGLRFLNMTAHVQTTERFDFINDFKNILEQLGHVTDIKELRHLTQTFFKDAFSITPKSLHFATRSENNTPQQDINNKKLSGNAIEQFLNLHDIYDCPIAAYLKKHQILIHDEIEFSHFYETDETCEEILTFLKTINADIFLPIFDKHRIIGYIVIERHARQKRFYNNVERDEMLVYASYLSNIITLLNHKNLQSILAQEKELKEELFNKHQEITLYKESIRSFLRTSKERKIGIVFYKSSKLKLGNQAAQELIGIDLLNNNNDGHPTKKTLKQIGRFVQEYKQPQAALIQDSKGEQLMCNGLLNIDGTHVIIIIHYPEIADIVKKQVDMLKDPSKWDYLLYLETTKSGRLINRLIPSSSESLLNFKIDLLKTALTTKAALLDFPEKDLEDTVNIIHNISLRQKLETIVLKGPEKGNEIAIKLFGINPIFGIREETPLLETLNSGTLFIKNIHYLSLETQRALTNVIKYGFYTIYKGSARTFTDVRIICSTDQNLLSMVKDKFFYEPLYHELKKASLTMPSLLTLPEHELTNLATALSEQAVKEQSLKNLLELSISEKNKLVNNRPISLYELRNKIHQIVQRKSTKSQVGEDFSVEAARYISDPDLENLQGLGKQALKDPKIMSLLNKRFKKQSDIAKFLGVARSSVSRRLKTINDSGAS